jgi:hypothetical protein
MMTASKSAETNHIAPVDRMERLAVLKDVAKVVSLWCVRISILREGVAKQIWLNLLKLVSACRMHT